MAIVGIVSEPGRERVAAACVAVLAVLTVLETTALAGWPAPLPSAWALVGIVVATRIGGMPGGMWAGALALGYAAYTAGFTIGHVSGLDVWGKAGGRTCVFGLAAVSIVVLVRNRRPGVPADQLCSPRSMAASMPPSPDVAGREAAEALSSLRAVTRQSAHDLNNLLLVIVAFAEPEIAPLGRPSESDLTPIEDAVERCAAIARRLLAESREPALDAAGAQGHVL